jgi:hypothetical protein
MDGLFVRQLVHFIAIESRFGMQAILGEEKIVFHGVSASFLWIAG